ncbi:MAG: molybdopterin-dependent oxidoreductase [Polyangia bacterium]|jgi:CO/xanthine dehydrogenase Mo-binding subunit/aerobic-type carbon monoxide dehydrogenase small subunit (CoxS/CutS family)|nr:molybdopterin-dependent oxidoreductase [Polyangia bacterium]
MSLEPLTLNVNGSDCHLLVEPGTTLLAALRESLDLTGTKCVCQVGECGACTVLVDGQPLLSCATLARSVAGKRITTIEGLTRGTLLHPLQTAFIERGAIQCGYCTPGMILAAKALLDSNPSPCRREVEEHLAGNLCRCTGYVKIVHAVLEGAEALKNGAPWAEAGTLGESTDRSAAAVGRRIVQPEAVAKATGTARYVSDLKLGGMLTGKVLRSPHPHALVKRVDKSRAEALPGVLAVLGPGDIEEFRPYDRGLKDLPMIAGGYTVPADERVLNPRVRHVGDAVAAVAAVDEPTAERALELIEVEYELLPFVVETAQAMAKGAPRISEFADDRNVGKHISYPYAQGDVEKAFAEAHLVVEGTFRTTKQEPCTEETAAAVASVEVDGTLTVYSQCQLAHMARRELAHIFNIPVRKVRLVTPVTGGSFGQRGALCAEPAAVALALKTRRPVKVVFTREENFLALETRTGFEHSLKLGFAPDGTLTAMKAYMRGRLGGYMGCGPMASGIAMLMGLGHYRCPNRAGEADMVMTNTPVSGAMRGFGNPAIMWGIEQLMDEAGERLGLDPAEIRLKNLKEAGEIANLGLPIESTYLKECILEGARALGFHDKRGRPGTGRLRRGVGMATMSHCSGAAPLYIDHSNAVVKFNEDGTADLVVHPAQVGQHIWGALTQIAAQELGLEPQDVKIVSGDTDVTLFEYGSDASRSTYAIGNATLGAARQAKTLLLRHAAQMLSTTVDDLELASRRVRRLSAPSESLSIAEVCNHGIYNFEGKARHFVGQCSWESKWNSPPTGAYFAEVEVDTETGVVRVVRFVTVIDCGKAINPMAVEGQIEGAIQQGIGFCLTEDYVIDPATGAVLTDNYDRYKMPGTTDMPEIQVIIIDQPDPQGPFGAKGVGEAGMVGVAPAIGNAIYDAVGVRMRELPVTPEKLLAALVARREV